jgi:hypothetical protein
LSGVLVLTGTIDDDLDSVASLIILQGGAWGPGIASAVGDTLNNGSDWHYIRGWSTKENERDGSWSGRIPGDGERLASWDLFVQSRVTDWVSGWFSNWCSIGRDDRGDCGDDGED